MKIFGLYSIAIYLFIKSNGTIEVIYENSYWNENSDTFTFRRVFNGKEVNDSILKRFKGMELYHAPVNEYDCTMLCKHIYIDHYKGTKIKRL